MKPPSKVTSTTVNMEALVRALDRGDKHRDAEYEFSGGRKFFAKRNPYADYPDPVPPDPLFTFNIRYFGGASPDMAGEYTISGSSPVMISVAVERVGAPGSVVAVQFEIGTGGWINLSYNPAMGGWGFPWGMGFTAPVGKHLFRFRATDNHPTDPVSDVSKNYVAIFI